MSGYQGKVLRINLSNMTTSVEQLDLNQTELFIGGRGLAGKIIADEVPAGADPLGAENKIIFATGLLTGTSAPTAGRYMVVTKSPLNNTIASSNSGGFWGAELKFAGYDMVIIEGKADKPVYLYINNDQVEIRPADKHWGKWVGEVTDDLIEEVGEPKARVLTIGPAGEKLSLIAAVMNEKDRAAGRTGVGAVMGSKLLKAIVVRGTNKFEVANPDKYKEVISGIMKKIRENGVTGQGLPAYGTAILVNIINESGSLPTKNFQEAYFDEADQTSGEELAEKYLERKDPCFRCPIACGRYCRVDDQEGGGPEYETVWAYGANCGVSDLKAVIKANKMCNEMGLDTISAGATIAAAMELYQRGAIKADEVDGPELAWGSTEAIIEWTKKMGLGEGLGTKLAMGSAKMCEEYGYPELSMTVKKQELPAYDPRGIQGIGLNYATSNRGGCHVRGYLVSPEILGIPEKLDRNSIEGKAEWAKVFQDLTAVVDSMGLCLFTSFALTAQDYVDLHNAATGKDFTVEDILACGDRAWNVERLFNLQEGYTAKDDVLPKRLMKEEIPSGPSQGSISRLEEMLPLYYKARGWDDDGVPTDEKKQSLKI
ncbi:aldehyde ferredoxin oxidoreductase family protein [Desulfuribacillus alkaliarsenatis]|uniref:Aldehyde ferredoxin oxidoreductase n=1 Tax=Desulfuribacillus alkaliarsenatis TaxID=766136 RepID=A0A1E5FZV2_9FIRM|nr:aldehyde ferredoxin oxidoreductase family protein [Desulfuribacillus alkaliarsenatis]OEF96106.1 aldehyde ferredoxin oxidoreductase [Desulfuribacillus alkaliarsenatis]